MKHTKFKKFVSQYKDQIYTQAYYFTKCSEDAKDITQDVLIKLWHHLDKISDKSVKNWLLLVTKNQCIDRSRKRRELTESALVSDGDEWEFQFDGMEDFFNPEQDLINLDHKDRIMAAIQQLPEKIKNVIIMREIHDLKYEDIARAMEMPINSVKVYLHRGRKLLFEYLKPYYQRG